MEGPAHSKEAEEEKQDDATYTSAWGFGAEACLELETQVF